MSCSSILRSIDIFGKAPNLLNFEDPKNHKTKDMWKTVCGGLVTIFFSVVIATYLASSFAALESGTKDTKETHERLTSQLVN